MGLVCFDHCFKSILCYSSRFISLYNRWNCLLLKIIYSCCFLISFFIVKVNKPCWFCLKASIRVCPWKLIMFIISLTFYFIFYFIFLNILAINYSLSHTFKFQTLTVFLFKYLFLWQLFHFFIFVFHPFI